MSPNLLYFSPKLTPFKQFISDRLRAKDRPQWSFSIRGEARYRKLLRIEWKKIQVREKAKNKAEKLHQRNLAREKKRVELQRIRLEKARKKNEEFLKKQRAAAELKANEARVNAARKEFQKKTKIATLEGKKIEKLKEKERIKLLREQIKEQRKQVDREEKRGEREERQLEKERIKELEPAVRKELLEKQKLEKIDIEKQIEQRKEREEQERRFEQLYRETSLSIAKAQKREDKELKIKIRKDIEIELTNLRAQIKTREKAERAHRKKALDERKAFDKLLESELKQRVRDKRKAEIEAIKAAEKERLKGVRATYKEVKDFDSLLEREVAARVKEKRRQSLAEIKEGKKVAAVEVRPSEIVAPPLFQAPVVLKGYHPPPELINLAAMIDKSSKQAGDKLLRESALLNWLTTPWRNLAKLPDAIVTDYKEIVLGERKEKLSFSFPLWEDVFRTGPEPTLTDKEWKDYKAWNNQRKKVLELFQDKGSEGYKKAIAGVGLNPLSQESQEILRKRAARRQRMKESPTPKTIQNIVSTLTWIDDIQDGFVTLAYLYKVGLRILGHAAPKVGLKFVPYLGYILLAKDLFDLAKWVRGAGLLRSAGKRGFYEFLENIPWLTKKKIKPLKKLRELLPTFAEAIQIAQTTEVLTGYGLRIGPLFGLAYDSIFGLLRGAEFKGLDKAFNPKEMVEHLRKNKVPLDKSPNLTPASTDAIRILNDAPHVLMYAEDLSFDDNIQILTACNMAATYLEGTGDLRDWEVWAKDSLDVPDRAISISNEVRDEIIEFEGVDPGTDGVFPYLDNAKELSPRMKSSLPGTSISDSFRKVLKPHRDDPRVPYFVSLIEELSEHLFRAFEGKDFEMKTKMNTDAKSYFLLQEYGLASKLGTTDELHMSLAESITHELIRTQRDSLSYQEIDAMVNVFKFLK